MTMQGKWKHYYQGKYKILVNGQTVDEGQDIADCRRIINEDIAPNVPDGTKIMVRQSNPAKRRRSGYMEPNQEAYLIENGQALLTWKRGRKASTALYRSKRGWWGGVLDL